MVLDILVEYGDVEKLHESEALHAGAGAIAHARGGEGDGRAGCARGGDGFGGAGFELEFVFPSGLEDLVATVEEADREVRSPNSSSIIFMALGMLQPTKACRMCSGMTISKSRAAARHAAWLTRSVSTSVPSISNMIACI